jgi:hypothetical protein
MELVTMLSFTPMEFKDVNLVRIFLQVIQRSVISAPPKEHMRSAKSGRSALSMTALAI